MPAIETGGAKTGGKRKRLKKTVRTAKQQPAPKVTVTVPDAHETTRTRSVTESRKFARPATSDAPKNRVADTQKAEAYVRKQYEDSPKITRRKYVPHTTVPPKTLIRAKLKKQFENPTSDTLTASVQAPVLKVLEQTTRPLHAIAGATDAAVQGKDVGKAALRGIENKDKTTFSDVLGHAGWKPKSGLGKAIKAVVSTTADIGLDPTTYLTAGSGSIAAKAGTQAAKSAEKKALKQGLTAEQARKFGDRAAKQAARTADQTRGVTVKLAGKELPGVRKATAKASKPVRAAGRTVVPAKLRENLRAVGADVNPDVAPVGVSKETSRKAVQATRTARAQSNRGLHEAQQHALGIRAQVGEANYSRIIDAIEAGNIKSLPPELRDAAIRVRSQFRHANRQRKQAGIRGGEVGVVNGKVQGNVKGYIPHHLTDEGHTELGHTEGQQAGAGRPGRKVIRPSGSHGRADTRKAPLSELRVKFPGQYSEDLPKVYAKAKAENSTAVARAELNRRLADLGTTIKRGSNVTAKPGESVYHIVGSDISKPLTDKQAQKVVDTGTHITGEKAKGRYVVLNDDVVKRAIEGSQPTLQGPGIVRGLDKTQAGFKRIALATPGFHLRNLVGDTQNAYLGQSGHRVAGNMADAGRILKAEGRGDKALRDLSQGAQGDATLKTGHYGEVTYEEAAKQLTKHGAMRSGYTARELPELTGEKATVRRVRLPRKAKQALLNREDLPRLTTAVEALKKGATWEEAAQKVADYHFDYGHLTSFERNVARRAAPFYTFTARNIPLQTKSLITKPGKFANFQKVREEASKSTGMDEEAKKARDLTDLLKRAGVKLPDGWESNLSEWEQRNAGVPISWKGHKFTVSMGLPLADLNEVPGAALSDQIREYYQKAMSMTSPLPKDVIEYMENHSFFFRDQIERDNAPLVAAPSWVRGLPESLKKQMGVTENWVDKKTGKKQLGYRAKADYVVKAIPGTPAFLNKLATDGTDRQGKGRVGKLLSFAGVKATPFDPTTNAVNLAYARGAEIEKRMAALRQTGVNADNPTREYAILNEQLKITKAIEYQGKASRGDVVLPKQGGPSKGTGGPRVKLNTTARSRVKLGGGSSGRVKLGG